MRLTLRWTAGHVRPAFHLTVSALLLSNKARTITRRLLAPSAEYSRSFCMHFCDVAAGLKYTTRQAAFFVFLRPRTKFYFCELLPGKNVFLALLIIDA